MAKQVLILGGGGRVGSSVALDLLNHTQAQLVITGRSKFPTLNLQGYGDRIKYLALDLADSSKLSTAITAADLAVHCAGPFRQRDTSVLKCCIEARTNYVDVSDDRVFTQAALESDSAAKAAGVTAVVNTGVFPGISNSMVRQGIEQFDTPQDVHISYVVGGSGGAGITVMRTTFLNIQHSFDAWIKGQWQRVKPYTDRETIEFPEPFGQTNVYWFDMPEAFTLAQTFPLQTVITKFGTFPDVYNRLTWLTAHWFPKALMQQPKFIEALAQISHRMTDITDRFSGVGVAVRVTITGSKQGKNARYSSTFQHRSAAVATGIGTGSISQLILSQQIQQAGVWPVEQALLTEDFTSSLQSRGLKVQQAWE